MKRLYDWYLAFFAWLYEDKAKYLVYKHKDVRSYLDTYEETGMKDIQETLDKDKDNPEMLE